MGCFDKLHANNPFRNASAVNVNDVPPPAGPPPPTTRHDPDAKTTNTTTHAIAARNSPPEYAPPPGPPPQQQHNWQAVPLPEDTSGYPPPPDLFAGHDRSWAANATPQQAEEGERWCSRYPLLAPQPAPPSNNNNKLYHPHHHQPFTLLAPHSNTFRGTITPAPAGVWTVRTARGNNDHTITAQPPLYAAARDDPRSSPPPSSSSRTIYFEVRVRRALAHDAGLGLGFVALPYPGFRMPGWHRGSVAVHSDDGHRYVNDRWGGVSFVRPWGRAAGTVVGVGMTFSASAAGAGAGAGGIEAELFFTRNGEVEARWDVNGERDQQRELAPMGVQGFHDLVAAVGSFEETEYEVLLTPDQWVYKGVPL